MHQVQLKFSLLKLFRHPEDNLMRNLPETDCLLLTIIIFILLQNYCSKFPRSQYKSHRKSYPDY